MPPRKKAPAAVPTTGDTSAGSASGDRATRPTRSSTRIASGSQTATSASASKTDAESKAKPTSKPKATKKRSRASQDDNEETSASAAEDSADKPPAKKAKVDDVDKDNKKGKQMVTVLKRGAAPVDPESPYVYTHQVYQNAEGIWDAMLNQTDVVNNSNKFYVIQVLHPSGNNSACILYLRWGRVGEKGSSQTKGPFDPATAIYQFKKQFQAKTGASWERRKGMAAKKGKYTWIERDFEEEKEEKEEKEEDTDKKDAPKIPDSTLHHSVQALCKIIFSASLINAALSSMNYDANKLPLGKLAKSTILNGFAALKELSEVIDDPNGDKAKSHGSLQLACQNLSNAYYSIIPHSFGRNRPIVINDVQLLKRELELVDALGEMEIAQKLISSTVSTDEDGNPINELDARFRSLGLTSMEPIDPTSTEFSVLEGYARDTHGATHRHLKANILHAFRVERQSETEAWYKGGFDKVPDGERLLLWHGSRAPNFAGILKQGLRIAPPEAPVNGYMFGKGVYFADMMSKSAGYCYHGLSNGVGILLLCEVAAKPFHELYHASYNANVDCPAANKRCTKGIGRTQPTKWKDAGEALNHPELKGCEMPAGPGEDVNPSQAYLQYNEYIVYDTAQIRLRYLLMVKMN